MAMTTTTAIPQNRAVSTQDHDDEDDHRHHRTERALTRNDNNNDEEHHCHGGKEAVDDLKTTIKCLLTPRQRLEMACSLRREDQFGGVKINSGRCTMRSLGRNYTL